MQPRLKIAAAGTADQGTIPISVECERAAGAAKVKVPNPNIEQSRRSGLPARDPGMSTDTRSDKEIAVDVGRIALSESGKSEGYQLMTKRAPVSHQQLWQMHDVVPRAIDREVVESFYRNTMGVDQDCKTLIKHASRFSLADNWGGAMPVTDTRTVLP